MVPTRPAKASSVQPVPMPSFMSPDQVAHYLSELRSYQPPRPSGARPQADKVQHATSASNKAQLSQTALKDHFSHTYEESNVASKRCTAVSRHPMTHVATQPSQLSDSNPVPTRPKDSNSANARYIPYYERGQRWMEKQEAHSLTRALQQRDAHEDARIYASAQHEAANLVWSHQNPHAPYANPDFDFRQHLKQGSHARSQSIGPFRELYVRKRDSIDTAKSPDGGSRNVSSGSDTSTSTQSSGKMIGASTKIGASRHSFSGSVRERAIAGFSLPMRKSRKLYGRDSSGYTSRKASDESSVAPFSNPDDRIFEEAEESHGNPQTEQFDSHRPLRVRSRNTSCGITPQIISTDPMARFKSIETPAGAFATRYKNGIEVRSNDIRAATSMRLGDRSPRLPQPSIVSNRPGRPIVSFEPGYYEKQENLPSKAIQPTTLPSDDGPLCVLSGMRTPDFISSEPHMEVPKIQVKEVPLVVISSDSDHEAGVPSIVVNDTDTQTNSKVVGSTRFGHDQKFTTHHKTRPAPIQRPHWSPASSVRRQQAQCASCALGIEGKIVSAAGERFHPQCFTCYHCGELLECVAFYPEPEKARNERLQRYEAQAASDNSLSSTDCRHDDGDPGLRFYCHLDYHEKFSPRCRSCKTPIEGKVIVACGGEWHEGHFFCAECGDPFDPTIPFIEKDGYAWCVPCHTRRFSGKCAGCRKPIIDVVINALGKEWHEDCFCCGQCGSQFDNGRFFTPKENEGPICVKCEEQRLKA